VGEALTGSGTGGEYVALAGAGGLDRLLPMTVKAQFLAAEIVPPEAKFGLSESQGSGHWHPFAIRSSTWSLMALSWMSTKDPVNSL
jgi:hypothetical protein